MFSRRIIPITPKREWFLENRCKVWSKILTIGLEGLIMASQIITALLVLIDIPALRPQLES